MTLGALASPPASRTVLTLGGWAFSPASRTVLTLGAPASSPASRTVLTLGAPASSPASRTRSVQSLGLTLIVLLAFCPPHAQADPKKSPATLPAEYTVEHLANDVELPDLPAYPNNKRKLISALSFPHVAGGPCYVFRYSVNEDSKQVLDWYCVALKNYNWKIERADRSVVIATNKSGSWCNLIVQSAKTGERTRYELQYRASGKAN